MTREEKALSLSHVVKAYRKYANQHRFLTLKSAFLNGALFREFQPEEVYLAVDDVSLEVEKGKTIGIIGENGSGKSTLMKMMAGIARPNRGTIDVNGRVSALIELGAGFHPEISGRENVYINGIILGLTKKEISARFDEIVRFAELEDFIDQPVKTYSSGMFMRLGFSVAINVNPDILLVDEVLSVGDASFVPKCLDKINEFKRLGKTIVFVSHDLETVTRICDEAVWMRKGHIVIKGYPKQIVDAYLQDVSEREEKKQRLRRQEIEEKIEEKASSPEQEEGERHRWGDMSVEILKVTLRDGKGNEKFIFHPEDSLTVEMEILAREEKEDFGFGIAVINGAGVTTYGTNTFLEEMKPLLLPAGNHKVSLTLPSVPLINGFYFIDAAVHSRDGAPYDYHHLLHQFRVDSLHKDVGHVRLDHSWSFGDGLRFKPQG